MSCHVRHGHVMSCVSRPWLSSLSHDFVTLCLYLSRLSMSWLCPSVMTLSRYVPTCHVSLCHVSLCHNCVSYVMLCLYLSRLSVSRLSVSRLCLLCHVMSLSVTFLYVSTVSHYVMRYVLEPISHLGQEPIIPIPVFRVPRPISWVWPPLPILACI